KWRKRRGTGPLPDGATHNWMQGAASVRAAPCQYSTDNAGNSGLVATIRGRGEAVAERLLRAPSHDLAHDAGFLEGDTGLVAHHVQVALRILPKPNTKVLPLSGPLVRKKIRGSCRWLGSCAVESVSSR